MLFQAQQDGILVCLRWEIQGGTCYNARVGLSPKHGISCQEERLSFRFRVSMTGWPAASRSRSVKKRVEKLFVWSISPSRRVFFRGKNRIAFRKEMNSLPQRQNFFAARQFLRMQEEGKNRVSEGFSRSGWSPPACKSRLSFCKPFPRGADAGRAPAARRSVADGKMSRKAAFGFHPAFPWAREVCAFSSCSRPVPVCAVFAGGVLTF